MTRWAARFGLQVISLLIAILAAWYVRSDANFSVRSFSCPIEFHESSSDVVILSPVNPSVQVTVKGPSYIVDRLLLSPPILKVQLPMDKGKKFTLQLDSHALPLPPFVGVVGMVPDFLPIVIDDRVERQLPVVVPKLGALDDRSHLDEFVVIPEQVVIAGAASRLKDISSIQTEPLELSRLVGEGVVELILLIPSPGAAAGLELHQRKVKVKYRVAKIPDPTPTPTAVVPLAGKGSGAKVRKS